MSRTSTLLLPSCRSLLGHSTLMAGGSLGDSSARLSRPLMCVQLVMRWFQFTIADFEESINPPNGGLIIVERKQDAQVGTQEGSLHATWGDGYL